jgi:hypothetical protein
VIFETRLEFSGWAIAALGRHKRGFDQGLIAPHFAGYFSRKLNFSHRNVMSKF